MLQSLEDQSLWPLAEQIFAYSQAVGKMEDAGVLLDPPYIEAAIMNCNQKQQELQQQIDTVVGSEINLNSPAQIGRALGLAATHRMALEDSEHPVAELINQYRQWGRARDTYFKPFLEYLDPENRLHPEFHLLTKAGRASVTKPALQTLPRESKIYNVRGAVISPPGKVLIDADESQIELRLLAHHTADPNLLYAYRNGIDVHTQTGEMLNIPRQAAKRVNFTIAYLAGSEGLIRSMRLEGFKLIELLKTMEPAVWRRAEITGKRLCDTMWRDPKKSYPTDRTEEGKLFWTEIGGARNILDDFNTRFPAVRNWLDRVVAYAKRNRQVEMWTGRKRRFPDYISKEGRVWNKAYAAPNPVIQGGANEVLRIAITNLDRRFQSCGPDAPTMHLMVHDSLILEIKEEDLDYWIPIIKEEMCLEKTVRFAVPLAVDCKHGRRWNKLEKWKGA